MAVVTKAPRIIFSKTRLILRAGFRICDRSLKNCQYYSLGLLGIAIL